MSRADLTPREPAPYATFVQMRSEGLIPYQLCESCQGSVFYPRVLCPHCGSVDLAWRISSGRGLVYSETFVSNREGGGYQVLLVDLEEGFRLMASADTQAEPLAIGERVQGRVEIDTSDSQSEPRFVFALSTQNVAEATTGEVAHV